MLPGTHLNQYLLFFTLRTHCTSIVQQEKQFICSCFNLNLYFLNFWRKIFFDCPFFFLSKRYKFHFRFCWLWVYSISLSLSQLLIYIVLLIQHCQEGVNSFSVTAALTGTDGSRTLALILNSVYCPCHVSVSAWVFPLGFPVSSHLRRTCR